MTKLNDASQEARQKELEKLFSNVPLETEVLVDLPSKGKFYHNFAGVKVSPLLFEDEQKILASKNKGLNPVNEILSKCVVGVNVSDLLEMDKLYLLIKIKEISYGEEYRFKSVCPACGDNSEVSINVNSIPVNYAPDDLTDPREITLPVLKAKVKVRFPRNFESHYFEDVEKALQNLYRFVISINDIEDPVFISQAIKKLHIRDSKTLVAAIHRSDLGLDPTFQFECQKCGHNGLMGVPFDANFFSVS